MTGAMDFTRMDPRDRWWWKKLKWVLGAVNNRNLLAGLEVQHRHWITLFSNSALDEDSFKSTKENAQEILDRILKLRYPWTGDETAQSSANEDLVSQFREIYGYPGEPRYAAMLEDMLAAFRTLE